MVNSKNKSFTILIITLISMGAAINFFESFIPFPIPVPGGKWGFSNAFVLYAVVNLGMGSGIVIAVGKSILGAMLSGRLLSISFVLGISGAMASAVMMRTLLLLFKRGIGYIGLSVFGAFVSNFVQLFILMIILKNRFVLYQLPYFSILGTFSAMVNALVAYEMGKVKI